MRWLVLLATLGGCHKLFDIEHVDDLRYDARGSGSPDDAVDASPVACPILPSALLYDEDGDSIDDRCDACPTVPSDDTNEDGDALPNACDPHPLTVGDEILFSATFGPPSDITAFDLMGGTYSAANKGTVVLDAFATLRTKTSYTPTRVELRVDGMSATALSGQLALGTPSIECTVTASDCATDSNGNAMCLEIPQDSSTFNGQIGQPSTKLNKVVLQKNDEVQTSCTMGAMSSGDVTVIGTGLPGVGNVSVTTNANAMTIVQSIVIYGVVK